MTTPARTWQCLGVPIDCVAQPGGTELAPDSLRHAGVGDGPPLIDLGDTRSRLRDPVRDHETGVVAGEDVVGLTAEMRERIAGRPEPRLPLLVLGGCCTLLPGVLGGLRHHGDDVALVYLDGHVDLYDGRTSPTGEAADMPLAVLLGLGPEPWLRAAGPRARLRPTDITLLGPRDEDEARANGSVLPSDLPGLRYLDAAHLKQSDRHKLATEIAEDLTRRHGGGFWVHVDLDVLDESAFPATDYPMPGGLDWPELTALLLPLTGAPACRGVSIACYNPVKDPDRRHARRVVSLIHQLMG